MTIVGKSRLSMVVTAAWVIGCAAVAGTAIPVSGAARAQESPAGTEEVSAKIWVGHAPEFEECLRTAEIVEIQDVDVGVTNPKRAHLAPGGLCTGLAWKPIRPGRYRGFWESYKAEIAAYEIDKLLGLDMVPPTVERRVKGDLGAAVLWAEPARTFGELGGAPSAPPKHFASWNRQLIQAKMFDNLIGNPDPNLGNWMVDPAWNLILIDHTRALTSNKNLTHDMSKMSRIDGELWDRMNALTEESLTAAIGEWLGKGEIRAILERRKRMQREIDKLVEQRGEAAVFIR